MIDEERKLNVIQAILIASLVGLAMWIAVACGIKTILAQQIPTHEMLCHKTDFGNQRPAYGQTLAYWIGDLTDTGVTHADVHAAAAEWNAFWTRVNGFPIFRFVYSDAWADIRVLASPTVTESTEVLSRCSSVNPTLLFEPYWTDLRLSHGLGQWWNKQALSHEFGHTIGFTHTATGVMNPGTHDDAILATKWNAHDTQLVAGYYAYP